MPWYGWLVILALIALAVVYIVVKSKKAVRNFSGQAFGTNTIAEGLRQQKEMLAETPKSLKAMTSIFLPQIERDFPEFHYEHYKEKSENMLRSYISAVAHPPTPAPAAEPTAVAAAEVFSFFISDLQMYHLTFRFCTGRARPLPISLEWFAINWVSF